jgi:hypothetical protein
MDISFFLVITKRITMNLITPIRLWADPTHQCLCISALIYKYIYPLWSHVYALLPRHSKTSCYKKGTKDSFWDAPWADDLNPKVIYPIFLCHLQRKFMGLMADGAQLTREIIFLCPRQRRQKIAWWSRVNDRPVRKPQEQGVMNIAASFSLSKKPR